MATVSTKRNLQFSGALVRFLLLFAILIVANMLAVRFHGRLDLTKEKRFTLSNATKDMLHGMNDPAVIDVYLQGTFPAGFQRLAEATRERLQSFRDVAGNNIVFRFVDPFEGKTEPEQQAVFEAMDAKGIGGVMINEGQVNSKSQKIIFPYALVRYKGREMPVRLLEDHMGMKPLEKLNYSETLLEYKLASAIHDLGKPARPAIAWMVGHGESLGPQTYDLILTLNQFYKVDTINVDSTYFIPSATYKAAIFCKPTRPFDERAKFKIDQYVMRGGHILWMLEGAQASMDSLNKGNAAFLAMPNQLNLEDQLFRYGVRVNTDLIEDLHSNVIPLTMGSEVSGRDNMRLYPWQYFPLLAGTQAHPIVANLDDVAGMFTSSIDTSTRDGIKKTILLQSSKYSRAAPAPVRVALSSVNFQAKPENYQQPFRPAAVLLEGQFKSIFTNRMPPGFLEVLRDSLKMPFRDTSPANSRMIVVADGDIAENDYNKEGPMEVGYWRFTGERFANKAFLLNCLEYLTDPTSLLEARNKEQRLRQLDTGRVTAEKTKWQLINFAVPIALVLAFASAYFFFRKKKYGQPAGGTLKS